MNGSVNHLFKQIYSVNTAVCCCRAQQHALFGTISFAKYVFFIILFIELLPDTKSLPQTVLNKHYNRSLCVCVLKTVLRNH